MALWKIICMAANSMLLMPEQTTEITELEKLWNEDPEKVLIRGKVTKEASDFLQEEAFKDFGMLKKGAVGMELTKLILIAKDTISRQQEK